MQSYISQNRPVINEETVFLVNIIKEVFRKTKLQIERKDLIFEVCKNHTVAEKWSQYSHMTDWLIMEARHQVTKEQPKIYPSPSAFVDVSYVKTYNHL